MKPIAAKIHLSLKDPNEPGDVFLSLSGTLYQQNLIYAEPRELRRSTDTLELSVSFRDSNSFDHWLSHDAIQMYWADKFKALLAHPPSTFAERDVILEVDKVENCRCEESNFYILQGRSLQFVDELTCGNCLKQISYSDIPLEIKLEEWQTYYQRFYMNWLESGLFEKAAYDELTNYKAGKLNLEGERIRSELSHHFKAPVYMLYFVDEPKENQRCPLCAEPGMDSGFGKPSKICKECQTIFD